MECTDENKPKPSKASEVSLSDTINIDADPYSYHTFMFPFQWKYSDTDLSVGDKNKEDITKNLLRFLDEDSYWESYQSPLFGDAKTCNSWAQKEQARKDYSMYQYFNVPARKAIFGDMDETDDKEDKKGRVYNYIYNFNKNEEINQETNKKEECTETNKKAVDHKLYSIIVRKTKDKKCGENDSADDNSIDKSISDKDKDTKKSKVEKEVVYICYDLRIKNIALRLYDSIGIGVVIYELENYKHRSMEDVIQINEYGRRIQLAMMAPDASETKFLTAARICIHNPHSRYFDQNFEDEVLAHTSSSETFPWNKHKLNAVSHTVSDLFMSSHSNELRVSFEKKEADKLYFLPYVDDRMFCMSLISDGTIYPYKSIDYKSIDSLGDRKRLEELYEYVFIDSFGGCTCQNFPMCMEMLEKALYLRWVYYGTVYGINRYSMVAITGSHEDVGDTVIQSFLTIYKEIVQIVLVQRAAINMFAERAMEISRCASKNKLIKNYMMELHQDYVSFKNQILLFEVTAQQQGIEIYDMVRDSMNIKQQKTELEEQFRMLFEISEMQSNDSTNSVLHTFTIFGLLFVGLQIIQQYNGQSIFGVIILMIFVVLFIRFIWYMGKHLKAPNKVEGNSKEEKDMLTFTIVCIIVLSAVYLINAFPFKDKILQWFLTLFRLK